MRPEKVAILLILTRYPALPKSALRALTATRMSSEAFHSTLDELVAEGLIVTMRTSGTNGTTYMMPYAREFLQLFHAAAAEHEQATQAAEADAVEV